MAASQSSEEVIQGVPLDPEKFGFRKSPVKDYEAMLTGSLSLWEDAADREIARSHRYWCLFRDAEKVQQVSASCVAFSLKGGNAALGLMAVVSFGDELESQPHLQAVCDPLQRKPIPSWNSRGGFHPKEEVPCPQAPMCIRPINPIRPPGEESPSAKYNDLFCSGDSRVQLWNMKSGELLAEARPSSYCYFDMVGMPHRDALAFVGYNEFYLHSLEDLKVIECVHAQRSNIHTVDYNERTQALVTGSRKELVVFDSRGGAMCRKVGLIGTSGGSSFARFVPSKHLLTFSTSNWTFTAFDDRKLSEALLVMPVTDCLEYSYLGNGIFTNAASAEKITTWNLSGKVLASSKASPEEAGPTCRFVSDDACSRRILLQEMEDERIAFLLDSPWTNETRICVRQGFSTSLRAAACLVSL